MRRVLYSVTAVSALAVLVPALIAAGLVIGVAPAAAAASEKVCTITDDRLTELSGMVATKSGYIVINDGTDDSSRERVFFLNSKCKISKEVPYSGGGPRDPEDLALSANGKTLWIADIGSNITSTDKRETVVLWSMPADGSAKPVLHRLTYPNNRTPDAEALLIGPDDTPYIITKTVGKAEIYKPSAPLQRNNTEGVALTKVGEVSLPKTTTANLLGQTGRVTVTGAARSPDGKRVVLRTYADAFEWDVPSGDVVKALTSGTPRATALADPFGEAITYSPDGASFRTVSDLGDLESEDQVVIYGYTPAKQAAPPAKDAGGEQRKSGQSWTDKLTLDDITYLIGAVGVLGALLVGAGVFGIIRSRRQAALRKGEDGPPDRAESTSGYEQSPVGARAASNAGGVYGRREQSWAGTGYRGSAESEPHADRGARPGVYGGAPSGGTYGAVPAAGGTTYGGGPDGGNTYGSGPAGRRPRGGGGVYGGGGGNSGSVYGGGGQRPEGSHPRDGGRPGGRGSGGGRRGPGGEPGYRDHR